MEALASNEKRKTLKRAVVRTAGLLFGLLIALTLFSNTLVALTLPKVITERPSSGTLDLTFQGNAVLRPAIEADLSNPAGGKVAKVLVKEGDAVRKGQVLVQYDGGEAGQQIGTEQDALAKLKLSEEKLEDDYIQAARDGDPAAIAAARNALESAKLDVAAQESRIRALQARLASQSELAAPFDGIVTAVNAIEGLPSAASDIRLIHTEKGFQFEMEVPADLAADLAAGDSLRVRILGENSRMADGQIKKVETGAASDESGKSPNGSQAGSPSSGERPGRETSRLLVSLHDEDLRAGDRVQVELSMTIGGEAFIISSKAVRYDRNGAYVFTIRSESGPLGNVYNAAKSYVEVSGEDGQRTAIRGDFWDQADIIVESSEPLEDGQRVRY